jgi:NADPH-dependent 2,4-dienoyl-CoA reductase/sulfur reductase-like enzyme
MELVVAVAKRKLASIDVVSMDKAPFENTLGIEIGRGLQSYHEKQGVKFHLGAKIDRLVPAESDSTAVGGVVVGENTILADVVIMGIGVAPATEFLKNSGFPLEKDGGVLVDEYLRVKGKEGVYAIGDIAVFPQLKGGEPVRIEHWNVAGNHGRAVGKTVKTWFLFPNSYAYITLKFQISGDPQPFVKVPIFWSARKY